MGAGSCKAFSSRRGRTAPTVVTQNGEFFSLSKFNVQVTLGEFRVKSDERLCCGCECKENVVKRNRNNSWHETVNTFSVNENVGQAIVEIESSIERKKNNLMFTNMQSMNERFK